jgi:hypothetical protein
MCTATSAMYVEFIDMYSTDRFLMAIRKLMGAKGTLTRIQSDQGDQLVVTCKEIKESDFKGNPAMCCQKRDRDASRPYGRAALQ